MNLQTKTNSHWLIGIIVIIEFAVFRGNFDTYLQAFEMFVLGEYLLSIFSDISSSQMYFDSHSRKS